MQRSEPLPYQVPELPHGNNAETVKVLKKLAQAHRYLAELKGVIASIPNDQILLDTLSLQEAKDSSAIENIITTHDEIYISDAGSQQFTSAAAKEVHRYAEALKHGFRIVIQQKGIGLRTILEIQAIIETSDAGFRKVPGTKLLNDQTGEVVYVPPQDLRVIESLMTNLEKFLNDDNMVDLDPLIKMAIAHFQFETIHPFYDGNGRTGRIINVLYLVRCGLLDLPILYLSRYIIRNKAEYYRMLQETRKTDDWEPWILYILEGVASTAKQSIGLVKRIKELMLGYKQRIRREQPRIYSQDLINTLFRFPYTKIAFIQRELNVSRITATRYLNLLVAMQLLTKVKIGRTNFYLNEPLFAALQGST